MVTTRLGGGGSVGGNAEMLRLLRRAVDLAKLLPSQSTTSQELLRRLTSAAARRGLRLRSFGKSTS